MYRNVVYNGREGTVTLFGWDKDGNRTRGECSFEPYLYTEDPRGDKTSIFGTKVKKRSFNSGYDRYKFINNSSVKRVFENAPPIQQFLLDMYWEDNEKPEFTSHPIKYCFIDIETYSVDSFPDVDDPTHVCNVITCWDNFSKKFHTFGIKPYTGEGREDLVYHYCKSEREMFIAFLKYFEKQYPDILSGWNSEFFDIPYIINRMERILGQEYVDKLSPLRNVYFRMKQGKFGQEQKRYYFDGVANLDYLDVYRRFCLKLRPSYKLDAIGELELGQKKIDYEGLALHELADQDWNKFIDYNIQDVNLLVKLEEKLQYMPLLRMLSYVGLTTLEGAMGTIGVITGALIVRARDRGEVMSTFIRKGDKDHKNPGAYVAEPKRGFKENLVSFDANSLYPNVMISLNTSHETKVGKIVNNDGNEVTIQHTSGREFKLSKKDFVKFLKEEECALAKSGFLFSQKKQGIIPEFLEYYYDKRVIIKKELFKCLQAEKKDSGNIDLRYEVERLNTSQMVIKILINSCYGAMGNKNAPIGDDDIAASVTLTGQAVIKQSNEQLKTYIRAQVGEISDHDLEECIVYNDTDSSYISITPLIENGVKFWEDKEKGTIHQETYDEIQKIEDYLNSGMTKWAEKALLTKDSRFIFKREMIADIGLFLQKKRYVMHILDDEGIKVNKFKYTGVEVVRTTMPDAIKPYAKGIIETMMTTKSLAETNKMFNEAYDTFKTLKHEELAFVMGVKGYEKYSNQCTDWRTVKGMPVHAKSAYFYNQMLNKLGTGNKYEHLSSGDKVRFLYIEQPNRYGLASMGFKYSWPDEFNESFKIDYEKMFDKILFQSIARFYDNVGWNIRKPSENVKTELFDLFA